MAEERDGAEAPDGTESPRKQRRKYRRRDPETLGESLFWSYANLASAQAGLAQGDSKYGLVHYMIRAKFYKRLNDGTMNIGPIAEDEKLKLVIPQACCYCAATSSLAVDHLLPRSKGGRHAGDNMVWSCKSCNSSKGSKDVLVWLAEQGRFPPLLLLRRYLKLAIEESRDRDILGMSLEEARKQSLPFSVDAIPQRYPPLSELMLWVVPFER
jgi:5-methylcytosine-specific restriction endonuclease McrA